MKKPPEEFGKVIVLKPGHSRSSSEKPVYCRGDILDCLGFASTLVADASQVAQAGRRMCVVKSETGLSILELLPEECVTGALEDDEVPDIHILDDPAHFGTEDMTKIVCPHEGTSSYLPTAAIQAIIGEDCNPGSALLVNENGAWKLYH